MRMIRGSGGFTLVEVIIASILLAIITAGIAVFFMHMVQGAQEMDQLTKGLQFSREKLEEMRTIDVTVLPDGPGDVETLPGGFQRQIFVSTPYSEYPSAKLVRCEVTWDGPDGPESTSLSIIF